ncbi:carboxymuconolactone decarboxylase family protein [Streptomyces sp. NPDC047072]|uniref:carboxymuconolactone decarboxylase family protein n=1 Tax=Streptomyces sp. NPDC047072 TaxID=3154809 RepID=UPI0033E2C116
MKDTDELRAARDMRRAVLGDTYVDAQTTDPGLDPEPEVPSVAAEFQDYLTTTAWGVWARGGALSPRDRSLLVLAMTAALGRMEEFRLHLDGAPRIGVTDAEVDELLFQIAAYCGAPAGSAARRSVRSVRAQRGDAG